VLGEKVASRQIDYPDSYPADEPMRRCPDISKARVELGYEPQIDMQTGLGRFFGWARNHYKSKDPADAKSRKQSG
jgi:UDP-glucuronate decarboxylase